jgi:N-acylneuraminate cytidylyltransferase
MTPLVIVPARAGSVGVPNKNFRELPDGSTCIGRAIAMGRRVGDVIVTTDHPSFRPAGVGLHRRPPYLASDTATMGDVVRDVIAVLPELVPDDATIVLLQPTAPLRKLRTVQQCLAVMSRDDIDLVATARAVPEAYLPDRVLVARHGAIRPATDRWAANRQDARRAYVADGVCYVFRRHVAEMLFDYARLKVALVTSHAPTINVDTMADWHALCAVIRSRRRPDA